QMLAFWNADSFLVSDGAPWGQIGMAATIRPRIFVDQYQTGASCCYNGGNSMMGIDLENNIFQLGEQVFSILDGTTLGNREAGSLAPERTHLLGGSFAPAAFRGIDLVAPIDGTEKWNTPLGPLFIDGFSYGNIRDPNKPEDATIMAMAARDIAYPANPDFGKTARKTAQTGPVPTILRGMVEQPGGGGSSGLFNAFARAGVTLREGVKPLKMLDMQFYREPRSDEDRAKLQSVVQNARQIESDMAALGRAVYWSKHPESPELSAHYCEHFPQYLDNGPRADDALTYYWMDLAYRFDLGGRLIWVTREQCSGGATGGTLVDAAGLNIFDSQMPGKTFADYRVEEIFTLGTSSLRRVFQTDFETKLFNNNLLVTYAPAKGALMVFDLSTRKFLLKLQYGRRGDLLEDVFVDADGRHLFQLNSDGSFTVYRLSDAAAILEGRYLDDELVVWTADFHFDATEEGAAFVELRFPGQAGQYSFQQFDGALRVPGLLQTVLSGGAPPAPQTVGVPPKMEGRIDANANRITGLALAKGTRPIKAVRLFQDGVLTSSFQTNPGQLITVDAARNIGTRWATLVAEDVDGLVSLPLNVDLGPDPAGLPRTHFLGVGVDYYAETRLEPLNYAKLDAVKMSDTFSALNGRTISMVTNTLLTDRRASQQGIPDAVDALLDLAEPGDHVVLFFAGHGLQDADGNFYFGLSETTLDDLPNTALNWLDLSRRFAGKGVRITVLLDACHAGAAGTGAFATNDAAVAGLTASLSGSMTVLSAAKGRQFSGESPSVGGGYFTDAIQDVLLNSRGIFDENSNGVLEAVEFYRGVKTRVVEKRGAEQTPWLSRNQLVGEYGLF
ncbi:MAG: caspase family protein, partial [Sulfitobacter sp.]